MPLTRRFGLIVLAVLAAAALALYAFYAWSWEGRPRAHGALAEAFVGGADSASAPQVVQARNDPGAVILVHGVMPRTRATRIDLTTGATSPMEIDNPFDRERFDVFDELSLKVGTLRLEFAGIPLPRPRLQLFGILGDVKSPVTFETTLTGREQLLLADTRRVLLSRRVVNGRSMESARRHAVRAFLHPNGGLVVCIATDRGGTTVWSFSTQNQEKR